MGLNVPSPKPLPPPPPATPPEVDEEALAKQRRDLEAKRTGRAALRIDPSLGDGGQGMSGTGLRIGPY